MIAMRDGSASAVAQNPSFDMRVILASSVERPRRLGHASSATGRAQHNCEETTMRIIDAWVNGELPSTPAGWQKDVAERLFKRSAEAIFRKFSAAELLASMDEAGVDKAILTLQA